MKHTKKLLIALVIVLLAGVVVPNIVPVLNSTISVEAASIKMNTTKKTLYVNKTYTLKVVGTKKKAKWLSSNKKVATVSSKGKVTAKKKGTATITAKVGSKKYTCKITVKSAEINKNAITLYRKNSYTLKVLGATKSVKWYSSNKSVATVSSKGQVTAKKKGTAKITAKMGNKKYTCKVTVKSPYIKKTKLTFYPYEQYSLCVYGRTSSKWKKSTKWTSSNKAVATVTNSGRVTALKKGTAKITATYGREKYTCEVNVNGYVENKEATKIGLGLLDYTEGIGNNKTKIKLEEVKKSNYIKGMNKNYCYSKILNYEDDFKTKYTENCIKNDWYKKGYTYHIEEINGNKYLVYPAVGGREDFCGDELYIKKMTEDTVVFNVIAYYSEKSNVVSQKDYENHNIRQSLEKKKVSYTTKKSEFVIKKEGENWKVDKFSQFWFLFWSLK